jgi:hypothetical protein
MEEKQKYSSLELEKRIRTLEFKVELITTIFNLFDGNYFNKTNVLNKVKILKGE